MSSMDFIAADAGDSRPAITCFTSFNSRTLQRQTDTSCSSTSTLSDTEEHVNVGSSPVYPTVEEKEALYTRALRALSRFQARRPSARCFNGRPRLTGVDPRAYDFRKCKYVWTTYPPMPWPTNFDEPERTLLQRARSGKFTFRSGEGNVLDWYLLWTKFYLHTVAESKRRGRTFRKFYHVTVCLADYGAFLTELERYCNEFSVCSPIFLPISCLCDSTKCVPPAYFGRWSKIHRRHVVLLSYDRRFDWFWNNVFTAQVCQKMGLHARWNRKQSLDDVYEFLSVLQHISKPQTECRFVDGKIGDDDAGGDDHFFFENVTFEHTALLCSASFVGCSRVYWRKKQEDKVKKSLLQQQPQQLPRGSRLLAIQWKN